MNLKRIAVTTVKGIIKVEYQISKVTRKAWNWSKGVITEAKAGE